jgi:hypothetical protein
VVCWMSRQAIAQEQAPLFEALRQGITAKLRTAIRGGCVCELPAVDLVHGRIYERFTCAHLVVSRASLTFQARQGIHCPELRANRRQTGSCAVSDNDRKTALSSINGVTCRYKSW